MTERAVILVPLICTGMDPQVVDTFLICVTIHGLTESHLKRSYLRSASHMPWT